MKNKNEENSLYQHLQELIGASNEGFVTSSIKTGFSNIDQQLHGLQLGGFYTVGAAPAMGLKTFIGQLSLKISNHSGVLYLPQKSTAAQLSKKLLCIEGHLRMHQLEHEKWDEKRRQKVTQIMFSFKKRQLFIEKSRLFNANELMKMITDYVTQNGVKMVVIDDEEHLFYNLKGMFSPAQKHEFMVRLKMLFRQLNCCGIILKKIKPAEQTPTNPFRWPKIKDIQEEYDLAGLSDHIWFLHRLEYYGMNIDGVNRSTKNRLDLYVMDEDGGVLGNLYYRFNRGHTGFEVDGGGRLEDD